MAVCQASEARGLTKRKRVMARGMTPSLRLSVSRHPSWRRAEKRTGAAAALVSGASQGTRRKSVKGQVTMPWLLN